MTIPGDNLIKCYADKKGKKENNRIWVKKWCRQRRNRLSKLGMKTNIKILNHTNKIIYYIISLLGTFQLNGLFFLYKETK